MITPTIGRVVWFTPSSTEDYRHDKTQPLAALVAYVENDALVNLTVSHQDGSTEGRTSVPLLQDHETTREGGYYAEWMPYQKGQAAKADARDGTIRGVTAS